MLNGRQLAEIAGNDLVGIHEGIPAGYEDVGDLPVIPHIGHRLVHPAVQLVAGQAHHPLAEAMAAVHGALVGGQQQGRLGVLVLKSLQLGVAGLAAGVEGPAGSELVQSGHAHAGDGVRRICRVHQGEIIGRNHHGEALDDLRPPGRLLLRPAQYGRELFRRSDPVSQFLLPAHQLPPPFKKCRKACKPALTAGAHTLF